MAKSKFSAGAVVLRRNGLGWRYLLLRVFRTWDFPKGGVERGESPLEAAIREVEEETSLVGLKFHWGEAYRETQPYSGRKIARYYLAASEHGEVSLPVNPLLGRPEHHEFRWCPYDTARQLLPERLQPILSWARDVSEQTTP